MVVVDVNNEMYGAHPEMYGGDCMVVNHHHTSISTMRCILAVNINVKTHGVQYQESCWTMNINSTIRVCADWNEDASVLFSLLFET